MSEQYDGPWLAGRVIMLQEEMKLVKAERDALKAAAEKGTEYVLAQINQGLKAERDELRAQIAELVLFKETVILQCAKRKCAQRARNDFDEVSAVEAERDALKAELKNIGDLKKRQSIARESGLSEWADWAQNRARDAARGE